MKAPLATIQSELRKSGLDAWLVYDYLGSNPVLKRLLDTGRQRGLSDPAGFRRAAKMALPRQGNQVFELVDHFPPKKTVMTDN